MWNIFHHASVMFPHHLRRSDLLNKNTAACNFEKSLISVIQYILMPSQCIGSKEIWVNQQRPLFDIVNAEGHLNEIFGVQWRQNAFENGGRHTSSAKRRKCFCRVPPLFGSTSTIIVVLVSAFVMVSTVWSFYCAPRAQPFVKVESQVFPVPYGVGATVSVLIVKTFSDEVHCVPKTA